MTEAARDSAAPPIEPGVIELHARVTLTAALKLIAGYEEGEPVEEPSLFLSTLIRRGSVSTAPA